jgi:hypothetical protein
MHTHARRHMAPFISRVPSWYAHEGVIRAHRGGAVSLTPSPAHAHAPHTDLRDNPGGLLSAGIRISAMLVNPSPDGDGKVASGTAPLVTECMRGGDSDGANPPAFDAVDVPRGQQQGRVTDVVGGKAVLAIWRSPGAETAVGGGAAGVTAGCPQGLSSKEYRVMDRAGPARRGAGSGGRGGEERAPGGTAAAAGEFLLPGKTRIAILMNAGGRRRVEAVAPARAVALLAAHRNEPACLGRVSP